MKKVALYNSLFIFLCFALSAQAVNQSYYSSLEGLKDSELRSAITSIVYTHHTTALGYNWNFADMDIVNNEVLDMYSTCTWTETTDQCGSYSGICGCYNREHIVPQSLFNEQSPQVGDRHHLFLTDGKVNGVRSNYAFGETNATNTWNGISNASKALGQLGAASYAYSSSVTVFEPDDQYKGDIARAILYMVVRYATTNECRAYNGSSNNYPVTTWNSNEMFSGSLNTNYGLSNAAVQTFLKWHRADPVSSKEIARNTGVENAQHNRNPFVDYPILVEYLWGKYAGETFSRANAIGSFEAGFTPGVSDGDNTTPVVPYNVLWMADGSLHAQQTAIPEDPDNCSTSRVFVGWTGTNNYSGNNAPADLFTTGARTITKDTTFYAIYADKGTGSGGSTTIVDTIQATSPYVTLTGWTTDAGGTYSTSGNYGASVPSLKLDKTDRYVQSATLSGAITAVSYWYKPQSASGTLHFYVSSDGETFSELSGEAVSFSGSSTSGTKEITLSASNNYRAIKLVYEKTNSNVAVDDISITYVGSTSYANYSLSCSTTPTTLPSYMAPPAGYYNSIEGLQDSLLKSTLGTLSNTGTRLTYGNGSKNKTWYGFYFTDRDTTDNSVIDMYSNNKRYFSTSDSTASVDGCHIEHMLPKSWWGGDDNNAYKDLYHLVPSDGSANTSKNNWGPGVPDMSYASAFNNGKFYTSRDTIHNLTRCFAPSDEYKGDFARAYFYIVTTYGDQFTWVQSALDAGMTNDSYLEFQDWLADLLMEWHRLDPVSEKEVRRAYEVNKFQGNRNPFIDYPCLAEYIWGTHKGEAVSMSSLVSGYDGMGTDCCGSSATTYTITWSVNGATNSDQVTQGEQPTAPNVENCSSARVFKGWTTSSNFTGVPSPLYASNAIPNASANVTYYAVYADKSTGSGSVTDSLTYSSIGIGVLESGSATYADFTDASITSNAVYAGNVYKFTKNSNPNYIQLKSNGSTSGIITTTSGGTATKVKVSWNSGTTSGRTVDVYGKTSAYSAASDLYDNSTKGTKIGSIVYGTSTELTISGNYTHIGLRSNNGALYLDTIAITWNTGTVTTYDNYGTECEVCTPAAPVVSFANNEKNTTCGGSVSNALNKGGSEGTVTYSSSNTSVATVNSLTGAVTIEGAGTTTITANIAAAGCYTAASTSYTLTVNKTDVTASFNTPTTSLQVGQTATSVVTTNSTGAVTYSSNNTSVATVNATTGQVTAVAAGTARITANIAATNCQNANSAYYDITITPIPTYTVTWKANGVTIATETVQENGFSPMPSDPEGCSGRVFMGWTVEKNYEDETDAPEDLFTSILLSPNITQDTTIYAIFADVVTTPGMTTKSYTFNITKDNFTTGSYADNNTEKTSTATATDESTMDVKWTSNQVYQNSSAMQWQKNNGYIYNSTNLGTITAVTITSSEGTFTTYYGSSEQPSSSTITGNSFFKIVVGNATGKTSNIAVSFNISTPSGTNDTTYSNYSTLCEDFMALAASEITANSFIANWTEAGVETYSLDVMTATEGLVPQATTFYTKDFTESLDGWTINNVSGYENVWTYYSSGSYKYAKATSRVSGNNNEAESWFISPSVDLTSATSATLTMNHTINYGNSVSLMITSNGGSSWTQLSPEVWPTGSDWTFVNSESSLASYKGKTIKIGLKYIGTTDACPTWEINTLTISGIVNVPSTIHQSIYGYPQPVTGTSALVNDLSPETTYYYTVTPEGKSKSNEIEVTTLKISIPTDIENNTDEQKARKVLINGQLFILRGEKIYTIQGLKIK